jgi:hypothetical protein
MKQDLQNRNGSDERIRRLLALKRYEMPDPHVETRTLARLRERLAHTAPGMSWGARVWDWLAASPMPLLRAISAVVLVLLGLHLWMRREAPESRPGEPMVAEVAPKPITEAVATPAVEAPAEDLGLPQKPVFVFEYPSNREPAGPVRMGPTAVPVRYDF